MYRASIIIIFVVFLHQTNIVICIADRHFRNLYRRFVETELQKHFLMMRFLKGCLKKVVMFTVKVKQNPVFPIGGGVTFKCSECCTQAFIRAKSCA